MNVCKLLERKEEFTSDFLKIIFQLKSMRKVHTEKYNKGSIENCPCKYKIGEHFLSTLETNLVSVLSSIMMCLDKCSYDINVCSDTDLQETLNEFAALRTDMYLPALQCSKISRAFARLFSDIMEPVDMYFISAFLNEIENIIEGDWKDLSNIETLIIDYVDTILLSLYGLVIDCNNIINYDNIEPKCIEHPECPVHTASVQPKLTIFLIDNLIDKNLVWLEHLVDTFVEHYDPDALKELDLIVDFRFVKKNVDIDITRVLKLVDKTHKRFKSIIFRNAPTNLQCVTKIVSNDTIKKIVKIES